MIECPECLGVGRVNEEYQVGGYTPDRWTDIRERNIECPRCSGWGEIDDE